MIASFQVNVRLLMEAFVDKGIHGIGLR